MRCSDCIPGGRRSLGMTPHATQPAHCWRRHVQLSVACNSVPMCMCNSVYACMPLLKVTPTCEGGEFAGVPRLVYGAGCQSTTMIANDEG